MKKKIVLLIIGSCLLSGALVGCNTSETDVTNSSTSSSSTQKNQDLNSQNENQQEKQNLNQEQSQDQVTVNQDEENIDDNSLASVDKRLAEEAAKLPSSIEEFAASIPEVEPLGAKTDHDLSRIDQYIDFHLPKDATEEQCQQFVGYTYYQCLKPQTTAGSDLSVLYDIFARFNDLSQRCIDNNIPLTKDGLIFENYDRAVATLEKCWNWYDLSKAGELYGKADVIETGQAAIQEYRDWVNSKIQEIRDNR